MPVLGSPVPNRFGNSPSVPSFPGVARTYATADGTIIVPGGALDRWFAYRATGAAVRRDIPVFGDSTTWGSQGNYSWVQRLRDRMIGFGLADSGKGFFAGAESLIVYDSPEVNGIVSSGWGGGFPDSHDLTAGQFVYDSGATPGNVLIMQFIGTGCRIWYSIRSNSGDFTYSIDGGAAVTVHTNLVDNPAIVFGGGPESRYVAVSGLTEGTHTVTLTTLGGRVLTGPTFAVGNNHVAGSLPASTTYRYAVTTVTATGESMPTAAQTVTTEASGFPNHQISVVITNVGGAATGYNIYRADGASGGTFLKLATATPSGGTFTNYTDDGSLTPAGASPPVSSTAGRDTAAAAAYAALGGFRATGAAPQKYATSGAIMDNFTQAVQKWWDGFGLAFTAPNLTLAQRKVATNLAPFDSTADKLNPVLAMLGLGFNDLSNSVPTSTYSDGVLQFAAACQAAGCDGIVFVTQLAYNANWPSIGAAAYAALRDTAIANGLAFIDLLVPVAGPSLSYTSGTRNPHLSKAQYVSQADFLWDSLLGLTA